MTQELAERWSCDGVMIHSIQYHGIIAFRIFLSANVTVQGTRHLVEALCTRLLAAIIFQ